MLYGIDSGESRVLVSLYEFGELHLYFSGDLFGKGAFLFEEFSQCEDFVLFGKVTVILWLLLSSIIVICQPVISRGDFFVQVLHTFLDLIIL